MSFQSLIDGTASVQDFGKAKKMAEFFEYVEEQTRKPAEKEEVEYFD